MAAELVLRFLPLSLTFTRKCDERGFISRIELIVHERTESYSEVAYGGVKGACVAAGTGTRFKNPDGASGVEPVVRVVVVEWPRVRRGLGWGQEA